jgi:hypothetical protein
MKREMLARSCEVGLPVLPTEMKLDPCAVEGL